MPPWRAALGSLEPSLRTLASRASRIRVLISDHFVRYLAVPWDASLRGAERTEFLRHHFQTVFGARATGWTCTADARGTGSIRLAAAVDSELLAGLREAAARAKLSFASIQPCAIAAFNALRKTVAGNGFVLVREPGRVALVAVVDGAPRRLASQRVLSDDAGEIAALLSAEALEAGFGSPAEVPMHVAVWKGITLNIEPPARFAPAAAPA